MIQSSFLKPKIKFSSFQEYYQYFYFLIEEERKASLRQIYNEILNLDPEEREKQGRAILGLKIKDFTRTFANRWQLILEREKLPLTEINIGDLVIVSHNPGEKYIEGVVSHKSERTITLIIDSLLPQEFYQLDLRVDLFCNDVSFKRMFKALEILSFKKEMFQILSGRFKPQFKKEKVEIENNYLNESQKQVVVQSLLAKNLFLIQGPPGTGKTTTLAACCYEHIKRGYRVLATADSNIAVDNLVEALSFYPIKIVRLGHPAKVLPHLLEKTLDFILEKTPQYQELKLIWQEIERLKDNLKKLDKQINFKGKFKRKHLKKLAYEKPDFYFKLENWYQSKKEIRKLKKLAQKIERRIINQVISKADVVCATNSVAGSDILANFKFDVVFIDEANQSTEPSTLISLVKGKKFIMAGDYLQLPPTVVNEKIANCLSLSLFERLIRLYGEKIVGFLSIQYRMPEEILEFPNKNFYQGRIVSQKNVAKRRLSEIVNNFQLKDDIIFKIINPSEPICFVNLESQEEKFSGGTSYFNEKEAKLVSILFEELKKIGLEEKDIGIISPYADQVKLLKNLINASVEIKTVDGFQGREKEVIILSLVRANEEKQIGFLKEKRRLNVALTRAKRKLIVIGNEKTISQSKIYRELLNYFKNKNSFIPFYNF